MSPLPRRWARAVALVLTLAVAGSVASCSKRVPYHPDDPEVLRVEGVDIEQTLDVAEFRMAHLDKFQSLGLWIMRDQVVTEKQAQRVSRIYFENIDGMHEEFDIWHCTWAVRNLHDGGDEKVRAALAAAHADATARAKRQGGIADKMVNGPSRYHGDFHGLARRARHEMMVVPGNGDYTQSFEQYRRKHQRRYERKLAKSKRRAAKRASASEQG